MFAQRITALFIAALIVVPLRGEVGVRECITPAAPAGSAYTLPGDNAWHDVGTLRINNNGASDYVVSAMVEYTAGNASDVAVDYQITVDGLVYGTFTRRTPEVFPDSQALRAVASGFPDGLQGIHTIAVRARSGQQIRYSRVWITPLMVDSGETTVRNNPAGSVTVGTSWTNLAQVNISAASAKMLYLVAYATVTGGPALTNIQYRLTGASAIDTYEDSVPDVVNDGVHVAAMYKPTHTNSATYWFQARSLGGSFTVGARELVAQTMPHFALFQGGTGAVTVPNDYTWHTLSQNTITMPVASYGNFGTDGSGYSYFTYNGAKTYAETRLEVEAPTYPDPYKFWEVGWIGVQPSGVRKLEGIISDWEQLGFDPGLNFTMRLQMRGLCPGGPALSVTKSRFQVAVVPDSYAFTGASCADKPTVCCAANSTYCKAYECSMSLPLVGGVPAGGGCP